MDKNNEVITIIFDYWVQAHNEVIQSRSSILEKKTSSMFKQMANSYYYSLKNQIAWLEEDNHKKVYGDPNDNFTFKGRTEKVNQIPYDELEELYDTTNFEGFVTAHRFRTEVLSENSQDMIELTKILNHVKLLFSQTGWDLPSESKKSKASKASNVKILDHNSKEFAKIQERLKQSGLSIK
jgi:hypothetical protein